ncbi:glycoside hydrolase [Brachionus plicatilis]|uniref:Glycoside hydrolase n=1 Tax=Brachionus plicatilis TaxID=10195 RepID=A0A3M7SWB7_BRAPC|nr:glycoside hydrolase [Brachionus plicatilis]
MKLVIFLAIFYKIVEMSFIFNIKNGIIDTSRKRNLLIKQIEVMNRILCLNFCQTSKPCFYVSMNYSICSLYSFYAKFFVKNGTSEVIYEKISNDNFGLINYWPIENGETRDLVTSKDLFDSNNASFTQDRFGFDNSSLYFNNGYINAPSGIYFGTEFTVLAWVKLKNYLEWQRLFDFGNGRENDNVCFSLSKSNSEPNVSIAIFNGTNLEYLETNYLKLNEWYQLGFKLENSIVSIFFNDVKMASSEINISGAKSVIRGKNYFGKSNWNEHEYKKGQFELDEVKFFEKGLLDSEIESEFKRGYH